MPWSGCTSHILQPRLLACQRINHGSGDYVFSVTSVWSKALKIIMLWCRLL